MFSPKSCELAKPETGFLSPLEDYLIKLHLFDGSNIKSKVSICHINKNGKWIQETVSFGDLIQRTQEISHNNNEQDIYITQNTFLFGRQERFADNLNAFYIDIDYYNEPEHAHKSAEQVAEEAMQQLERIGFPEPTHVISSGRGLQILWCIKRERLTMHGNDIRKRWKAIQRHLSAALKSFGIDENAKDISRVFRIVGTINSKNGALVKLIWQKDNGFYRYKFEDFANQVFGDTREEYLAKRAKKDRLKAEQRAQRNKNNVLNFKAKKEARRKKRASEGKTILNGLPISVIMNMRAEELIRLVKVRFADGQIDEGQRNNFIFHIAVAKSYVTQSSSLLQKMIKIAQMIAPDLTVKDIENSIYSVLTRAEKAEKGELIIYNGRKRDPRYQYSTRRIINDLGITSEEMKRAGLVTLASPELKRKRKAVKERQRREDLGAREKREAKNAVNSEIWKLHLDGVSQTEIAKEMSMSRSTVRDRLKKLKAEGGPLEMVEVPVTQAKTAAESSKAKSASVTPSSTNILTFRPIRRRLKKVYEGDIYNDPFPEFHDIPLLDEETRYITPVRQLAAGEVPF